MLRLVLSLLYNSPLRNKSYLTSVSLLRLGMRLSPSLRNCTSSPSQKMRCKIFYKNKIWVCPSTMKMKMTLTKMRMASGQNHHTVKKNQIQMKNQMKVQAQTMELRVQAKKMKNHLILIQLVKVKRLKKRLKRLRLLMKSQKMLKLLLSLVTQKMAISWKVLIMRKVTIPTISMTRNLSHSPMKLSERMRAT